MYLCQVYCYEVLYLCIPYMYIIICKFFASVINKYYYKLRSFGHNYELSSKDFCYQNSYSYLKKLQFFLHLLLNFFQSYQIR